ncbi:STAS/SEC14 domain-containing protein [Pseudemcibacter aquimaris]|uniref:STAS/SEC14 domain-containing protein n=1 Tax=Pseudemcibacter aquimaris TaxID=2857064 RepID=UPI002011CC7B|nr:STAS/SEC14 domain-containing protein [Pseudemcibacter aquimaris]MCC3860312.1 STAS/SEC14 domain-containing protein [Pseudemcibacter aquimaris]WDU57638.1 hypothetical protein KW060_10570 [Pseudemcibacter aquimaris]
MPYQITSENRGIYIKLEGVITFKDVRRAAADGWEHENRDSNIYQIWDYRNTFEFEVELLETALAARMDNIAFSNIGIFTKIAVIADLNEIIDKYKSYQKYLDHTLVEANIFKEEEQAREWVAKREVSKYYWGLSCSS